MPRHHRHRPLKIQSREGRGGHHGLHPQLRLVEAKIAHGAREAPKASGSRPAANAASPSELRDEEYCPADIDKPCAQPSARNSDGIDHGVISLEFAIRRGSTHQFPLQPKLRIWAPAIVTWGNALRSSADRWPNDAARRGPSLPAVEEVGPATQFPPTAGRAFHLELNATLLISIVKFGPLRTPRPTVRATWRCRDWRNHRCAWQAFAPPAAPFRPPTEAADPQSDVPESAADGQAGW